MRKLAIATITVSLIAAGSSGVLHAKGAAARDGDSVYMPAPPALASHYTHVYEPTPLLTSGRVDLDESTITLPLHRGRMADGRIVWHVLTDVSDEGVAREMGLVYSPKLANATGKAVRPGRMLADGSFEFDRGTVDFSPERIVVPGEAPNFFPPAKAQAGSVGDEFYSPLVRVENRGGVVFNATIVAFDVRASEIEFPGGGIDYTKVIDRAVAISPREGTVTFSLNLGTSDGRPILFMSLDSNDEVVSALEATTVAPGINDLTPGLDDRPESAVAPNYIVINGPTGDDNPQKQGVNSALSDSTGQVFDIFDSAPGLIEGYSPMWDLYLGVWTDEAIASGLRSAVHSELQFLTLADRGAITGPGGAAVTASGLISNCTLVMTF